MKRPATFERWAAIGLAFVAVVSGAGCTSSGANATRRPSADTAVDRTGAVVWGWCPDDYFVQAPAASFDRDLVDCATVEVPAVYGRDSGLPDFRLVMMRLRTTGEDRKRGTLFVNPGGPGGSGIEEIQQQQFPQPVLDSYDIVGFDPRGTLHSQPVSGGEIRCSDELDFSSYWNLESTPANQAQADEFQRFENEFFSDCERRNPGWWTLGTSNVVRDLETLREQVTGTEDLNFLGSSYGTTIAAGYVGAFPEHVGHIVLDSPTDDAPDTDASIVVQARSTEEFLLRLVDGYANEKGLTRSDVMHRLAEIRDWGEADQLRGYAGLQPFPGSSTERLSNEYMFVRGLVALSYLDQEQAQPLFNQAIDDVLNQRWNWLFEYMALGLDGYNTDSMLQAYQDKEPYDPHGYARSNIFEISQMVNGIDRDQRDMRSRAEADELERKVKAAAPLMWSLGRDPSNFRYYDERGGNQWSWVAFDDPGIPDPPKRLPSRSNPSGIPVMVIGSRRESITPYPFAVRTARDLRSELITWEGEEHGPLAGFEHACLNELFVEYLIDDRLPDGPVTCRD